MTDPTTNAGTDKGHANTQSWVIGGTRIMRTSTLLAKQDAEREAERVKLQQEHPGRYMRDTRPQWMIAADNQRQWEQELQALPEVDPLTDHNYDGIQEYDNPTPGWWWMIFGASVAFAVVYAMVFHAVPLIPTPERSHAIAETRYLNEQFAELNQFAMSEEKLLTIQTEERWLAAGRGIFESTCALCHLADGSGSIGPNLTDDFFKNTDSLMGVVDVITNGAANGQMPAQKTALSENEIALVAAYVASLRGMNLPGKEPEGVEIPPFPQPSSGSFNSPIGATNP